MALGQEGEDVGAMKGSMGEEPEGLGGLGGPGAKLSGQGMGCPRAKGGFRGSAGEVRGQG